MDTHSHKDSCGMTVMTLSLLAVASVMSLRGLPMMAAEGLSMIFYILFATFIFLLPAALVSAELGSAFPEKGGGIYAWVSAAFGPRWGFLAVWLQWIQNVAWYPAVLGFGAACLAYLFGKPELANNGPFNGIVILVVFGAATLIALRGFNAANTVSKWAVILGTLTPAIVVTVLAIVWIATGHPIAFASGDDLLKIHELHVHPRWFPHVTGLGSISFLAGIVLLFSGIEVQAVQVREMANPRKQFPQAMFIASAVICIVFTLGSLAVATVVPAASLTSGAGLTAGLMVAFQKMFDTWHLGWLVPVFGLLTAFGAVGGVLCWVIGPTRGLLLTANDGMIPPFMSHSNKHGSPDSLLLMQFVCVALLSSLYFFMKNVSAAFYVLSAMTATLYLGMYVLMFLAVIRLRYSQPTLERPFKIGGGRFGLWAIAGTGLVGVVFALVVGFFPPTNLVLGSKSLYVFLVALGMVLFTAIAFIINAMRKKDWVRAEALLPSEAQSVQSTCGHEEK